MRAICSPTTSSLILSQRIPRRVVIVSGLILIIPVRKNRLRMHLPIGRQLVSLGFKLAEISLIPQTMICHDVPR